VHALHVLEVENDCVLEEGEEDKHDAGEQPDLEGVHLVRLGRVRGRRCRDVDQHEEEGDEERHSPGHDGRRNEETDLKNEMVSNNLLYKRIKLLAV
jgi:hypothetical protein